ncbi:MAG: putative nucleotidyltransferase substrate binding domain-containing protein [Desulfuromonadales bacterium]|nr:putative nucleotidyltransferase substrate binding domain-containing protein [Desulfuromonadales bacterium]
MSDENILFQPIKKFCRRNVATCAPVDTVLQVAGTMRELNISSMIICEENNPIGILTDRDLRNKVVAEGIDPATMPVSEIMNAPLITVNEDDFIFEALYRISKNGIHRICVIDQDNRLTGIITVSDIMRLQTHSPQKLVRDIDRAETLEELKSYHVEIQDLVLHLVSTGVPPRELVRMIALLNDQLLLRLIDLLRAGQFKNLTDRFAFIVLGSEGRREQTLTTDQDNAIIYADDLAEKDIAEIEAFSEKLIEGLIEIGVPPCPGGIMAKNAFWRRSYSGWVSALQEWLTNPQPNNILNGSMFFDLRTIYGDLSLEKGLKKMLIGHFQEEKMFLTRSAANVNRFRPPLGMFGGIKVAHDDEHRGQIDVKKAGIFAITEGIKALAMEAGVMEGGTRERIQSLVEKQVLTAKLADDLEASYNFLVFLRLRCQVEDVRAGKNPSNYITLAKLNHMEKGRLKIAFEEINEFHEFLRVHFRVHLLR